MNRLLILTIGLLTVATFSAANQFYQFPTAKKLKAADRILIFQNGSGNRNPVFANLSVRNITGGTLKSEINTNPVLQTQNNYSSAFWNLSGTTRTVTYGRRYMYFRSSDGALVITSVAP